MRKNNNHVGFTLVETILVLAVVGLIIGAIWLGYSSAMHVKRQTIGEQQISDILQATRNYMLQTNENNCTANYYGVNCPNTGNDITAVLINNDLVPSSVTGTLNNSLSVEYGTATVRAYNSAGNPYGSGPVIGLILTGLQQKTDCSDVASAWAGSPDRVSRSGIIGFVIAPTANSIPANATNLLNGAANGSILSSTITANCTAATNKVNLFFRLNP